jgi:hypothetical protein
LIPQQGSTYQSVAGCLISMQAHDSSIHGPTMVHLWSKVEPKHADLCRNGEVTFASPLHSNLPEKPYDSKTDFLLITLVRKKHYAEQSA